MSTPTPAVAALRRYLDDGHHSQTDLATALGISQPSVSGWLRGTSRPEPHLRAALEILAGIPVGDWDTEAERALVEQVRLAATDGPAVDRSPDFDQTATGGA